MSQQEIPVRKRSCGLANLIGRGYTLRVAMVRGYCRASEQAFHWIDPAYGLARAAELLKTGGTIALVWTTDRSQGSAFWQATAPIYDTYNPQTSSGNLLLATKVDLYQQKLLQTSSDHRAMTEPNTSRFFEAISQVITQMGGKVIRDYETLALLAKTG